MLKPTNQPTNQPTKPINKLNNLLKISTYPEMKLSTVDNEVMLCVIYNGESSGCIC